MCIPLSKYPGGYGLSRVLIRAEPKGDAVCPANMSEGHSFLSHMLPSQSYNDQHVTQCMCLIFLKTVKPTQG